MERIPDTSHTLVDTQNGLCNLSELVAACIAQQLGLLHDLTLLQITHANSLFTTIDICALDDRMFAWTGRNGDFDLRVCAGEGRKVELEEGAVAGCQNTSRHGG